MQDRTMKKLQPGGVAILLLCLITATTTFGQSSAQKETDVARDNELKRRAYEEQLGRFERLKLSFELNARHTAELLDKLAEEVAAFEKERQAILTNDEGKVIAADPATFMTFLRLHENPVTTSSEVNDKRIAAQAMMTSLQSEKAMPDVGYLPSPELFDELGSLSAWAKDRYTRLQAQRATLNTLMATPKPNTEMRTAQTMAVAIQEYHANWRRLLAESRILGEQEAKAESRKVVVEAARLAKLEQAQAESERILEQSRAEIAQLKLEQEKAILQLKMDAERQRFEAEKRYEDALAEIERLRRDAEVNRNVDSRRAKLKRQEKLDETDREENATMLRTPEVRSLLSNVMAEGYWQPGKRGQARKPGPVSYSQMQAIGALNSDSRGLNNFLRMMNDFHNDRPRWCRRGKKFGGLSNVEKERLVRTQQLIIEHGPLMVELGMLAP
jgi:hypothetical protein